MSGLAPNLYFVITIQIPLEPLSNTLPIDGKYELTLLCANLGGNIIHFEFTLVFIRIKFTVIFRWFTCHQLDSLLVGEASSKA